MSSGKRLYFWIVLSLIPFLFFSVKYLDLPGLQYDEVNFANAALGAKTGQFIVWKIVLFGINIPLMIMDYIGAVKSILYAPIFAIFGTSAASARLPVIVIGIITLVVSFAVTRRMFGLKIAMVATLLFSTDATFIYSNKLDWGPISLMLAFEVSSLYFIWRWMAEDKRRYLVIAGFLMGLGLYNKIIFAWYLASLMISLLLFFREKATRLLNPRQLIPFVSAFLLGCLPLIAFNIDRPLQTFKHKSVIKPLEPTFIEKKRALFEGTLDAGGVYYFINKQELANANDIPAVAAGGKAETAIAALARQPYVGRSPLPLALVCSMALVLVLWIFRRKRMDRHILFSGAILLLISLLICITPEATGAHHVIAIYPFAFMIVAWAVCELGKALGRRRAFEYIIIVLCLLPLLLSNVIIDSRYLISFARNGGTGHWADAIYDLASFANQNAEKEFICMEWGFSTQLVLLSHGRIRHEDFVCGDPDIDRCVERLIARPNTFLVFYAPPFGRGPALDAYRKIRERENFHYRPAKTFFQRDGRPVYLVYENARPLFKTTNDGESFYYRREAEDFDERSGGGLDLKSGASNGRSLGKFWGRWRSDFASYEFNVPADIHNADLMLRYAFPRDGTQQYYILLDGQLVDVVNLPSTGGFGYTADQWNTFAIRLGPLPAGDHKLTLKPVQDYQEVNLDYIAIGNSSTHSPAQ